MKIAGILCLVIVAIMLALRASPASAEHADVRALLEKQTRELMDAVTLGKREVWQRYLAEDAVYAAEDGSVKDKKQMVEEVAPLPKSIWGNLKVTEFKLTLHEHVAITNWVADEEEGYYGQVIHSRYRTTDTWVELADGWRLLGTQVVALRKDPPSVVLPAAKLEEYVGSYALTAEVGYTIKREGAELIGQRSGRKPEILKAEVADYFFTPGDLRIRKVFQRDAGGQITGFVERRESWDIAWKRRP